MNLKMKKLTTLLLAAVMGASFAACNVPELDEEKIEKVDPNRTQLYVGMFDGALGREWMDNLKAAYEAENPNVQIIITPGKSTFEDGSLLVQMKDSINDIYFLSSNTYNTFVEGGLLEDLTDTISEKVYDNDGNLTNSNATQSILDTMYEPWQDLFRTDDGKFYAIPNWMSTPGIVYDAKLFEDYGYEEPKTYNELIDLMDTMVNDNLTPFVFSTMDYITLSSIFYMYAQYEGEHDFRLNSTFSGRDDDLGVDINLKNAYLLQQQEGRKAALKFAMDLARTNSYTTSTTKSGLTHLGAQGEFVRSINTQESGSKRIAMLLEHSYWEREVKATIDEMGKISSDYAWGNRNFKYMLAPKFVGVEGIADSTNDKHTVFCTTATSFVCINKAKPEASKELAKDFLQFVQSRKGLAIYTRDSGCLRAYNYKMTQEEYDACTPFTRSLYDLTQRDDVEFALYGKANPISKMQTPDYDYNWMFYTKAETSVGGEGIGKTPVEGRSVFNLFRSHSRLTVQEYFEGLSRHWNKDTWETGYYNKLPSKYKIY